jgi:hypothetical protein
LQKLEAKPTPWQVDVSLMFTILVEHKDMYTLLDHIIHHQNVDTSYWQWQCSMCNCRIHPDKITCALIYWAWESRLMLQSIPTA